MSKPITVNLKVSYNSRTHQITIKPGPDVEVPHVDQNKINWIKKGKGKWRFALLSISPPGQFYLKKFQPSKQIKLIDNDRNDGPDDKQYTYTLSVLDTKDNTVYVHDPKIINKGKSG